MNKNTRFEIKADAFFRMTGMLPIGKSMIGGASHSERQEAWDKWNEDNRTIISAMLSATDSVLGLDDE